MHFKRLFRQMNLMKDNLDICSFFTLSLKTESFLPVHTMFQWTISHALNATVLSRTQNLHTKCYGIST